MDDFFTNIYGNYPQLTPGLSIKDAQSYWNMKIRNHLSHYRLTKMKNDPEVGERIIQVSNYYIFALLCISEVYYNIQKWK